MRNLKLVSKYLGVLTAVLLCTHFVVFAQAQSSGGAASPTPTRLPSLTPEEFIRRGNELYAKKEYQLAYNNYAGCFRIDPTAAHCAFNMGLARRGQGRFADAIRHYDEAIRLRPDWSEPYRERGIAYGKALNWAKCIEDISVAITRGDKTESAFTGRAECHRWLGRHKEAVDDLTAAIAVTPRVTSLNARAASLALLGRNAEAFDDLDRTKDIAATGFEQHRLRGEVALKIGKYDDAVAAFDRAIETAPPLRRGQPKGASALPDLYFKKGQALGRSGRAAMAFDAYTASLSHLDSAEVQKARNSIYALLTPSEKAAADVKLGRTPKPTPRSTPARTVARTTPPVAKPTPQNAAVSTHPYEAQQKAEDAAKLGDHKAVIAHATRGLELIPVQANGLPQDGNLHLAYIRLRQLRAAAYAATKDFTASDADYARGVRASIDGTLRHLDDSNAAFEKNPKGLGIAAMVMSDFELNKALGVCRKGVAVADEWRISANATRPKDRVGIKAGIDLMTVREICIKVHTLRANNLASTQAFKSAKQKRDDLTEAVKILTNAIEFANFYPILYTERAKVYRLLGESNLAAADEQKVRELEAAKSRPN